MASEPKKLRIDKEEDTSSPNRNEMPRSKDLSKTSGDQIYPPDGVIRIEVENVSTLDFDGKYSDDVEVGGVIWSVRVCKEEDDEDWLITYFCIDPPYGSTPWSIEVYQERILVHPDSSKNVMESFTHTNDELDYSFGENMMKWSDLIDENKGFIIDDKITIEIRFWIIKSEGIRCKPRFNFSSMDTPSDVVLIVEGKPVHVNKNYLAIYSEYFQSLFFGKFADKNQREFILDDVVYEEFIKFLTVIYPTGKKLKDDESFEYLLKLADRFQVVSVIDRAEKILIRRGVTDDYSLSFDQILEKLLLADRFKLLKVKDHCFCVLDDFDHLLDFANHGKKTSTIFNNLPDVSKTTLFEHLVKLAFRELTFRRQFHCKTHISRKPLVDEEVNASSPKRIDVREDPLLNNMKKELYKLPLGTKMDFSIKSDLSDATFVIEGKKIYAGKDFLSIYSTYFKALFNGDFTERKMEEIVLNDVTFDEFHEMLNCLVSYSRAIKAEFVESLLTLGDRFDIKYLVDRAEDFLMTSKEFTVSSKLLLADRFSLIRVQTKCLEYIGHDEEQTEVEVEDSEEFELLSQSAKNAYYAVMRNSRSQIDTCKIVVSDNYMHLTKMEDCMDEPEDFLARGMIEIIYVGGESQTIDVAGLNWTIITKIEESKDGYEPLFSSYLVVNKNRLSSVEWSVEGFVKEEILMDRKGKKEYRREMKYKFSLKNSSRIGRMNDVKWRRRHNVSFLSARFTIYITSISGVRKGPSFDFSAPDCELADAVFIVEGRKIHVNKQYLSTISSHFHEKFFDADEVEVKKVTYKEFIELLHVIYPSCKQITDESADFLLKLGKQFEIESLADRILDSDKISGMDKLQLADKYNVIKLKDHFLSAFNTNKDFSVFEIADDFIHLKRMSVYNDLTYSTKAALFEQMAKVARQYPKYIPM